MSYDEEIDPDFDRDDDILDEYLEAEGLLLVPIEFMNDLMKLMEAHIRAECDITSEELEEIIVRLEDLIGEDSMMDLSLEGIVNWVKTLRDS